MMTEKQGSNTMASLNKVYLMGNLTRDPELRYTPSGTAVCRLGLAVNRRFTTSQGESRDESCFIDIDVWGKTAEHCNQYLRKGSAALVEGRLKMDQWEDRTTGQKRSKLLVHGENVQFLGQPRSQQSGESFGGANTAAAPASPAASGGQQQPPPQQPQQAMPPPPTFDPVEGTDDDIPF
jgi:single-strand DNA-binding protein